MKKIITVLLITFQLLYNISIGYPAASPDKEDVFSGASVQEVRTYSSLITIVYCNTVQSLLKIAEFANLIPSASSPLQKQGSEPKNKTDDSNGLLPFSRIMLDSKNSLQASHAVMPVAGFVAVSRSYALSMFLIMMLIASICAYLYRLKLFYLQPRGTIDGSIFSLLFSGFKNPHHVSHIVRVFLLSNSAVYYVISSYFPFGGSHV